MILQRIPMKQKSNGRIPLPGIFLIGISILMQILLPLPPPSAVLIRTLRTHLTGLMKTLPIRIPEVIQRLIRIPLAREANLADSTPKRTVPTTEPVPAATIRAPSPTVANAPIKAIALTGISANKRICRIRRVSVKQLTERIGSDALRFLLL